MNFENEKYEYLLKTWGGFYNEEFKKIHGKEEGYFFFDAKKERKDYIDELKQIEKKLNARVLMINEEEGKNVRYSTIAKMKMIYNGKTYEYEEDFGKAYPSDSAHFMFHDGNYSCDCNRSSFLNIKYGDEIEIKDCGYEIEVIDFEVLQIKK